ncbi:sigma-70 family RNA polymerase sigma factor [Sphingomonas sp. ASV193]|uniref:sigma-70 family RNA polymerase sigma factor n=1 Tax=Sphingomonas sp. ASV193 TaxID=3144405 RepID=UPI0032E8FBF8
MLPQTIQDSFEAGRDRFRRIAFRMLGDWDEANDALQDAWIKAARHHGKELDNADAWLVTIVTRMCLDRLRQRRRSQAAGLVELDVGPGAKALTDDQAGPEETMLRSDILGAALLIIIKRLSPMERVAFVLHDIFEVPFDEISTLILRSPEAARKLASRARSRVRARPPDLPAGSARHRELADVFLRSARSGDLDQLLRLLHPQVILTGDDSAARLAPTIPLKGAHEVANFFMKRASMADVARFKERLGLIVVPDDQLILAIEIEFSRNQVVRLHAVGDPEELARVEASIAI